MAQEELQESKLTKAGGRKPTHGCNYPMVGWPSVILTPMGPSLNLTREGTSRPSLRSSLSLSSLMVGAYKAAYGLSKSTAQAFIHDETAKGGLGLPSLQVEYHSLQTQRLIGSLNDHGLVGRLTRASQQDQQAADADQQASPLFL